MPSSRHTRQRKRRNRNQSHLTYNNRRLSQKGQPPVLSGKYHVASLLFVCGDKDKRLNRHHPVNGEPASPKRQDSGEV